MARRTFRPNFRFMYGIRCKDCHRLIRSFKSDRDHNWKVPHREWLQLESSEPLRLEFTGLSADQCKMIGRTLKEAGVLQAIYPEDDWEREFL